MFRRKKIVVNTSLIVLAIAPIVLYAYEYGPDPGYSAAPGDNPTGCIDPANGCHLGTPNSGKGSIKIVASGGTTYVPGQTQTISVTIADSTEKQYGFQLSARVDSSPKTTQAGTLTPGNDTFTQTICVDNSFPTAKGCSIPGSTMGTIQWIEHTLQGYDASKTTSGSYTYKFSWTPPATNVGTVTLYAAGNAVTGTLQVTGTNTYLTSLQLAPGTGSTSTPSVTAVDNDASFAPTIASGSWVALFGTNLAPAGDSRLWNTSTEIVNGKFPTSLDGTSVTVGGTPAYVEYISPTQVNIQPPDGIGTGQVPVVVTTSSGQSTAFTATVAAIAPGLFPATAPYVVAQHADNSYVTSASPAKPGEVIVLWGTGFGPASPVVPAGQVFSGANSLANSLTATIGGNPATINFAGVVGAGLVQINVQVPANATAGDTPVVLTVGGTVSTQSTNNMIPIS
jgi:uncharacterized protein (TIGR03437 family)